MSERAEKREVPGAGESCRHTRWRLGESGPVWGKRNICAYYYTTQKTCGGEGWRRQNLGPLHEQGPTKHHTFYFNGPIWGFQSRSSLTFEKARQEPAQQVTRGLEEERRQRPFPPSQPVPYTLAVTCLFSGQYCVVESCWIVMLTSGKKQEKETDHNVWRNKHKSCWFHSDSQTTLI